MFTSMTYIHIFAFYIRFVFFHKTIYGNMEDAQCPVCVNLKEIMMSRHVLFAPKTCFEILERLLTTFKTRRGSNLHYLHSYLASCCGFVAPGESFI